MLSKDPFEYSGEKLPNSSSHFPKHKSLDLQILHHYSVSWKMTPLHLLSSNIVYVGQKEPIKVLIFETFECSAQNLSCSSYHFWNDKSILLQVFHHSSVSVQKISAIAYAFSTLVNRTHHSPNFNTFNCSSESLSNSSCRFPKHKFVFLQSLHHCSKKDNSSVLF